MIDPLRQAHGIHSVLWRRLDVVGLEACAIVYDGAGAILSGSALFAAGDTPVRFDYSVTCTADWVGRAALIDRWVGADKTTLALERCDTGGWSANGCAINGVDGLLDIDLGFSPATNTNAIKRLGLDIGASAELVAVWLDDEAWAFKPLRQRYTRQSETRYRYLSVDSGYEADLTVDAFGIVRTYPDLWDAVTA